MRTQLTRCSDALKQPHFITRIRIEALIDSRSKAPFLEEPSLLLPHVIRSHRAPIIEAVLRPLLVETIVDGYMITTGLGRGDEVFKILDSVVFIEVFEGRSGFTVRVEEVVVGVD